MCTALPCAPHRAGGRREDGEAWPFLLRFHNILESGLLAVLCVARAADIAGGADATRVQEVLRYNDG